jgi:nicotinate-nucleotide--dimethylbenzimidazole phosphoribosyltransferase
MEANKPVNVADLDPHFLAAARQHLDSLTKPPGSLGRLEELAAATAQISRSIPPDVDRKVIFVFAGDHGITEENVSAYPKEVTSQMVVNFLAGGAAINVLARCAGAEVVVVDMGVDFDFGDAEGLIQRKVMAGTRNFHKGPAMSRDEAMQCIRVGIDLARDYAQQGCRLMGTGDMGIGNTTASSAIAAVMTGKPVAEVTGRGTGITDAALANKVRIIEEGIALNAPDANDALDVLAKVGGTEIGGIAGLILGAAEQHVPVVIDGLISTAGAMIAAGIEPKVTGYLFAAHKSVEIGHACMLERMGLRPLLDLDLRLGEGTGGALAMLLVDAGVKVYREMATFDEAGVSQEKKDA